MYFGDESYVGGGERFPLNLAKGVAAAAGADCEVELLSYGLKSVRRPVAPGVTLRIMKSGPKPQNGLDHSSWELSAAMPETALLPFHKVYPRGTDLASALGKLFPKPISATDNGGALSPLVNSSALST